MFPYTLGENKYSKDNLSVNISQNKLLSMPTADSKISNHSKEDSSRVLEKQ